VDGFVRTAVDLGSSQTSGGVAMGYWTGDDRQPTSATLPPLAAPGDTAEALACSTTGPGTIPPPGSVTG
jgi:hypothetical protein